MHQRSLALREKVLGPEHPETGVSLDNIGVVLRHLGRPAEALPYHRRALAITDATIGPDTSEAGGSHGNLGNALIEMGKPKEAFAEFAVALRLVEADLGPKHPDLVVFLAGMGDALLDQKQPAQALPYLERAATLDETGDVQFSLARALWGSGGDKQRARSLAEQARTKVAAKDQPKVAAWLADPK